MTQHIVQAAPVGTNLGLYYGVMTVMGGHLLGSRGALIPALCAAGLERQAVKRTWQALAHGAWDINELLVRLQTQVHRDGQWQPLEVGGYRVKALDTVGFFRPRLQGCQTTHYASQAQRALPAQSFGILAEVGQVNGQAVTLPQYIVRAEGLARNEPGLMKRLARRAAEVLGEHDVTTADRGFSPIVLLNAGHTRLVLRRPKNLTMRRADPPVYRGRGRKPAHGSLVRPLARVHQGKTLPASAPDAELTWKHDDHGQSVRLHAKVWHRLYLPPQKGWTQTERALTQRTLWTVMVIEHPDFVQPWVLLLNLDLSPAQAYQVVRGRWGIEQPPLVAKQVLGAHRQFVHAPDMRCRFPELSLLAAGLLTYVAATQDVVPTGWWDRHPQRTAGRLRRQLARVPIAQLPRLEQLREKRSRTDQLPTGFNAALAAARVRRT